MGGTQDSRYVIQRWMHPRLSRVVAYWVLTVSWSRATLSSQILTASHHVTAAKCGSAWCQNWGCPLLLCCPPQDNWLWGRKRMEQSSKWRIKEMKQIGVIDEALPWGTLELGEMSEGHSQSGALLKLSPSDPRPVVIMGKLSLQWSSGRWGSPLRLVHVALCFRLWVPKLPEYKDHVCDSLK